MTFESSSFLVQLDPTRLPDGVTCMSCDLVRQHYAFHFAKAAGRFVKFDVYAKKAEDANDVLSCTVGNGTESHSFGWPITTYNLKSLTDFRWALVALGWLMELPKRWMRYVVVASAILLLIIYPPWYWTRSWKDPGVLGVRLGMLPELAQKNFSDEFRQDKWYSPDGCAEVNQDRDGAGNARTAFLQLSSPCLH